MKSGFMYLTAIIDVHSRYIVGWGLSNSLEASESLKVVTEAIANHGTPEILNSDQGSQFTCKAYVDYLKKENIKISMDGKGPMCRQYLYRKILANIKISVRIPQSSLRWPRTLFGYPTMADKVSLSQAPGNQTPKTNRNI